MFESDDFDSVLSQIDYSDELKGSHQDILPQQCSGDSNCIESSVREPECTSNTSKLPQHATLHSKTSKLKERVNKAECKKLQSHHENYAADQENQLFDSRKRLSLLNHDRNTPKDKFHEYDSITICDEYSNVNVQRLESSKNTKKRLLGNLFDHQNKRKFPGPAGLLTHARSLCEDTDLSRMEISSQDVNSSQEPLHESAFELALWTRLQQDLRHGGIERIDSINYIKERELNGRLTNRKAHVVTAFVEAIDRSGDDPLVVLRDSSGAMKCTLHRDAWSAFSVCIMSEYSALALWKPTIFTTGLTFKKHYLNITLANIIAIYYSGCNAQDDIELPSNYSKEETDEYIAIRKEPLVNNDNQTHPDKDEQQSSNLLEGLDSVLFYEDMF